MKSKLISEMKILMLDEAKIEFEGRKVFVRADFNVPQDKEGNITEESRIKASLPTIRYILERKGRLILASHLGRPKSGFESKFSLRTVANGLEELLEKPVNLAPDCIGKEVEAMVNDLRPGELILLENLRFHKEEEGNDPEFSRALAGLSDVYVNDAFGTCHRAHASTAGMTRYITIKCAGFLLKREIEYFRKILEQPESPFLAILGGAKVSEKIGVLNTLLEKVDALIIGGAMAYTFLKARGIDVGNSLVEDHRLPLAADLLKKAQDRGIKMLLPLDHVITSHIDSLGEVKTTENQEIQDGWMGVDIGPRTVESFKQVILSARTIFWNGPVGVFEIKPFASGTMAIARSVADCGGLSVIGGGDSLAAVKQSGLEEKISHLSTGGGASLELLEGKVLPGLAALTSRP